MSLDRIETAFDRIRSTRPLPLLRSIGLWLISVGNDKQPKPLETRGKNELAMALLGIPGLIVEIAGIIICLPGLATNAEKEAARSRS